ncbi:hypothetical protein VCR4J2_280084 [Vibrio coralliirubri]|nr:hypothetical protein VCR4J2_280084 [Vibrio coralliirubri]
MRGAQFEPFRQRLLVISTALSANRTLQYIKLQVTKKPLMVCQRLDGFHCVGKAREP